MPGPITAEGMLASAGRPAGSGQAVVRHVQPMTAGLETAA
jgi:hypothetical protein